MDAPNLCERVHVRGEQERTYLVMKVDTEEKTVDLVAYSGSTRVLENVPFSALLRPPQRA